MRNYLTFNGKDLREFGVYISGSGRVTIPEKAFNFQTIPGRNGDLIVGNTTIPNEVISYPAFIAPYNDSGVWRSFTEMAQRLRGFLMSVNGYAELRDTYDQRHYRLACFTGPTAFEITPQLDAGSFELEFNCKPQRYLVEQNEIISLSAGESTTIERCGYYYAEPLISVTGTGSFTVGETTVTIAENGLTAPIIIDCRLLECYDSAGLSANRYVSFSDYEFPAIADGTVINAGDVALTLDPRWYEL